MKNLASSLRFFTLVSLGCLALAQTASLQADPTPSPSPSPAESPAKDEAKAKEFDATDTDGLRPLLNQAVTITGTVATLNESKNGTARFLHFAKDWDHSITLVFFVKDGTPSHDELLNFVGKKIRVSGTLVEYQKQLEIKLQNTASLEILP